MKIIKKSKRITEAKPATGAPDQLPALNSANINALFSSAEFKKPVSEAEAESYLADGINESTLDNIEENIPKERILEKLRRRFNITMEQALDMYEKYGC